MRLIYLITLLLLTACTPALESGQVMTAQGIVSGKVEEGLVAYRGLKYATAERWAAPVPTPKVKGVTVLDSFGPACPQDGQAEQDMTEDCLYLNVFTPEDTDENSNYPVMVVFHGGGFRAGSGGYNGANLARDGVVVVTFNYRLGALGFFDYVGWDKNDIRNFGLLDQVEALKWVKANIKGFGGNPNDVTLAGHSAGGMSVQLAMVNPKAKGLFHKAIARAGYASWPFPKAANLTAEQRATIRLASLESLKDKPLSELVASTPHFVLPYTDSPQLAKQPIEIFRDGGAAKVPYISGANSYDGNGVLYGAGFTPERFLALYGNKIGEVKSLYGNDFNISDEQAAQRLFGDARYLVSARESVRAQNAAGSEGWLYYV
jgi:para-nitrobenzyl esterase